MYFLGHEEGNIRTSLLETDLTTTKQLLDDAEAALRDKDVAINEMTERIQQLEEKSSQSSSTDDDEGEQTDLTTAKKLLDDKEAAIEEKEKQIVAKDEVIQEMTDQIRQLEEKAAAGCDLEKEVQELQSTLGVHETRLLEVTKERLALVGERTRMQAKIASLHTQVCKQENWTMYYVSTSKMKRQYLPF